jgi:hypothetical protein
MKKKISLNGSSLVDTANRNVNGRACVGISGQNTRLLVGKKVRVNCYNGIIRKVITHIDGNNTITGKPFSIPLRNPLFVVKVDRRTKMNWGKGRIVFVPSTKPQVTLKLFSDEFEIL